MVFFAVALSNKPTKTVCLAGAKRGKTREFRLQFVRYKEVSLYRGSFPYILPLLG